MVFKQYVHISGPATEPVTLEEVKAHLLIEDLTLTSAQNSDLETKISAARIEAEDYLGQKIGTQTWEVHLGTWPTLWAEIPIGPLISVDEITYTDADGVVHVLDTAIYSWATRGLWWLKRDQSWPTAVLADWDAIKVKVTVGIKPVTNGASPETLIWPQNIKLAILYRVGTYWNIREDTLTGTTMQAGKVGTFEALLTGNRIVIP
jgi:uncharacterized phiE125 gp8 family phage protein